MAGDCIATRFLAEVTMVLLVGVLLVEFVLGILR